LFGFIGGTVLQKNSGGSEVKELAQEVSGLKEMMMISMLEKESATDRLKAVSLSERFRAKQEGNRGAFQNTQRRSQRKRCGLPLWMPSKTSEVTTVREGLVRAIAQQDSPLGSGSAGRADGYPAGKVIS